jgi:hypothetical protein
MRVAAELPGWGRLLVLCAAAWCLPVELVQAQQLLGTISRCQL